MDGGPPGPPSLTLIGQLDRYGGEITADLARYYGLDITDVIQGRVSPRRALALVEHLPIDSATVVAARGGPEFLGWDRHTYMLADLFDAIRALTHVTVAAHSKRPNAIPDPPLYPRPGPKACKQPNRMAALLAGEEPPDLSPPGPGSVIHIG